MPSFHFQWLQVFDENDLNETVAYLLFVGDLKKEIAAIIPNPENKKIFNIHINLPGFSISEHLYFPLEEALELCSAACEQWFSFTVSEKFPDGLDANEVEKEKEKIQ